MNAARLLALYERIAEAPDAVARLRRFVLDLAVRGKLVAQDFSDEPASELLKRIARERALLVQAGEIRKPKPLPPIDEFPFELPGQWRWSRIRDVTSDRGQVIPECEFTYIDVTAIDKEKGIVAEPKVLAAAEAPSRARKITRKHDVIYSCVRPYLLNVAVIENDFEPPPIASTAFAVLNGYGLVLPRYIWVALRSPFLVECVEATQRGQAYPAINDADFALLPFPLPPLPEQRRIVAKVDELMGLCDRLEAARAARETKRDRLAAASLARLNTPDPETFPADARFALKTLPSLTTRPDQIKPLRQTILNLAVRGKLVPQDPNDEPAAKLIRKIAELHSSTSRKGDARRRVNLPELDASDAPFDLPRSWAWCRFPELGMFGRGRSKHRPRNDPALFDSGEHPFIQTGDVARSRGLIRTFTGKYNDRGLAQSLKWPSGTLCITIAANIADSGILAFDACFPDSVVGFVPSPILQDASYFSFFMRTAKSSLNEYAPATAQKNINLDILTQLLIPLPPLLEQRRIVSKVNELMTLCDALEASLGATTTARTHLLEAALADALAPGAAVARAAE